MGISFLFLAPEIATNCQFIVDSLEFYKIYLKNVASLICRITENQINADKHTKTTLFGKILSWMVKWVIVSTKYPPSLVAQSV